MQANQHDQPAGISARELDRERILTYVDWAESGPRWYLPVYALAVSAWIASYDLGPVWGTVAALLFAATMGGLIRATTADSGVSLPRFRGMPAALQRTFLPIVVVFVAAVVAFVTVRIRMDDPSYLLLGVVTGPALAAAAAWNTVWFRREARRLAAELGAPR